MTADNETLVHGSRVRKKERFDEHRKECPDCEGFLCAGGKQFRYIPALNDNDDFIETLVSIVTKHTQGWLTADDAGQERAVRAKSVQA